MRAQALEPMAEPISAAPQEVAETPASSMAAEPHQLAFNWPAESSDVESADESTPTNPPQLQLLPSQMQVRFLVAGLDCG